MGPSAEPIFAGNCHCRDCQKASGSSFVAVMAVPATEVRITGDVKYYDSQADSGRTFSRGFCPECAARLFGKSSGLPDLTMITAGSLDDPNRFRPVLDFYVSSAPAWDHMDPALPKFAKLPA